MSNETDLDWLARNVHHWAGDHARTISYSTEFGAERYGDWLPYPKYTKDQWLARRAELQSKPSWKDSPEWAEFLSQSVVGAWCWHEFKPSKGTCLYFNDGGKHMMHCEGEVLGDWRDTLERRPVDLSEPADGAEEINAMAQRLLVALKNDPRSFDTGALAEMVELADAEIVKRDANVCGGEGYLNNHWFERGELPPVGIAVQLWHGGTYAYDCELIAKRGNDFVLWNLTWDRPDSADCMMCEFKPIPTEREELESLLRSTALSSFDNLDIIAGAIIAAGFRKEKK